ncbi:cytochrome c biogenesis protein ResB [Pontibacillus litoralis]|uniref:Cytochrome C biogenesis protein n=1 Tax=Pontibacillus litoralis JSM 072002 TaxID=1385512 RepID=A0A0A5HQR5_9BACI|nr:cytochrome c biogenesis protein ResB [Pontibacillus litoralis]KGX85957.1 cytochrome C biogenesis protein [Pontibacillus litoralis JSM 072002]
MGNRTCECGHVNPKGTVLCESCGKPMEGNQHIDGNEPNKLLNMRYDGSARRSKTYNKTFVDKVWNFFSSVKVGVWLIVLVLVASAIGTIYPQEMNNQSPLPAAQYYVEEYGITGKIYYQLGFHDLYGSWWYLLLVAGLAISLVIASLDRVVPLYRSLKKQKPKRHTTFMQRQRLFGKAEQATEQDKEEMIANLKKKRYKITEQEGHVLAEKGRFSRWGPYVNHIGLIIFLMGVMLRSVPFMYIDETLWVREGETEPIPGTDGQYYIENVDFFVETYDESDPRFKDALEQEGTVVSNYQTDAIIYERTDDGLPGVEPELTKIQEGAIQVNNPIKVDGFGLYQTTYQLNEFKSMSFKIHETNDKEEKAIGGEFTIDLMNPESEYILENGMRVEIVSYFPEFDMEDGEPVSVSKYPKNPAFVLNVYPPEDPNSPETSFLAIGANLDPEENNQYKVSITNFETRDVTGLTITKDRTLWILALGGLIFMIGVVQGMYWPHRRIWIQPKEQGFWLAAHTNKNWFGMKKEIQQVIEGTDVPMVNDQVEQEQ